MVFYGIIQLIRLIFYTEKAFLSPQCYLNEKPFLFYKVLALVNFNNVKSSVTVVEISEMPIKV